MPDKKKGWLDQYEAPADNTNVSPVVVDPTTRFIQPGTAWFPVTPKKNGEIRKYDKHKSAPMQKPFFGPQLDSDKDHAENLFMIGSMGDVPELTYLLGKGAVRTATKALPKVAKKASKSKTLIPDPASELYIDVDKINSIKTGQAPDGLPAGNWTDEPTNIPKHVDWDKPANWTPVEEPWGNEVSFDGPSRFKISNLEKLKSKYRAEFEDKYQASYDEKDLGIYAKLREIKDLERGVMPMKDEFKAISDEFINKHNLRTDYTPEEDLLIDTYTKGYDTKINKRGSLPVHPIYEEVIPKFEELVKTNKLKQPTELYRGEHNYPMKDVWRNGKKLPEHSISYADLQVGDEWMPNSFVSTSLKKSKAESFGSHYISKIEAPANQSVLFPNASGVKNYDNELEAVLPSKLRFKVKEVNTMNDYPTPSKDVDWGNPESPSYKAYEKEITDYHNRMENFYKYSHEIVNPYMVYPFLGAGAMYGMSDKVSKYKLGGTVSGNWLDNYKD